MKIFSLITIFIVDALLLSGCSQNDLARLVEPRKHKSAVVHHRPPVARPRPVQRQIVVYPKARAYSPRKAKAKTDCSYVVRDLSQPHSSNVWCRPEGVY